MSHYKLKTKFNTEAEYGLIKEEVVYAHHNLSTDYVSFYDEHGRFIMTIPDTIDNNLLDAINRLYKPFKDNHNDLYLDGVEPMSHEDRIKCNI